MRFAVDLLLRMRRARFCLLAVAYTVLTAATLFLAYQLRFDFDIPNFVDVGLPRIVGWFVALKLLVLLAGGQFRDSLSYFSTPDVKRIIAISAVAASIGFLLSQLGGVEVAPPRGVVLMDGVLSCAVLCGYRFTLRLMRERWMEREMQARRQLKRVGIIGTGGAGAALARELLTKRGLGLQPIAFFDDRHRVDSRVHGIPVYGPPECLLDPKVSAKLDEVIIARLSASSSRFREIVRTLQKARVPFRTIPSLSQLASGTVSVGNLRPVQIEDLLGRDIVSIDAENIREMICERTVMVTGAGGSIGSELCRQIASFGPCTLLMVERSEAALFPIEQELIERGYGSIVVPLVADIMDWARMGDIFSRFRPHSVFHAAAHKHVPMMEHQPGEAIRNNVLGTAQMSELARLYHAERFLMVSTDKAINPTSVMGATKRVAETFVQAMQERDSAATKFMAVRFGNVLGSSGSVVPIFARQIAAGGPVKVTHPEVTRYFMTISEAVSLVLQSAARAFGGEIFVLDMGKPIKIVDLARQMIELSGLRPETDIQVEFTGLRPGEKLYEELSHRGENVSPTDHPKILRLVCEPLSAEHVKAVVSELGLALQKATPDELKLHLKRAVPEYAPQVDNACEIAPLQELDRL